MTSKIVQCPHCKLPLSRILEIREEYSAYCISMKTDGDWIGIQAVSRDLRYSETIAYECPLCCHREDDTKAFECEVEQ